MNLKIDNIMTTQLLTINKSEGMDAAYLKMKVNGIRHLPVLDENNQVVGIISDRDIQRSMISFGADQFDFNSDDTVADYMSTEIKSVSHDAELVEVVQLMITHQISAALITDNANLVGIITHEDLLVILAGLLKPKSGVVATMQNFLFKSPIGSVAEELSSVGI